MKTVVTTPELWRKRRPGERQPNFTTRRSAVFLQLRSSNLLHSCPEPSPQGAAAIRAPVPSIAVTDVGDGTRRRQWLNKMWEKPRTMGQSA